MTKSIIKILSLLLSLLCVMPLIVGCLNDSPNDDNDDDDDTNTTENEQEYSLDALRENYPPIYEALISYFRIDEGEVTEEMLAKVERIDIAPSFLSLTKDGYTLYDVHINGEMNYGGALEYRMTEARWQRLYQQLLDNGAPKLVLNRFHAFYWEKNYEKEENEQVRQEMLRDYPECAEKPIRVLSSDIKIREENKLLNFINHYTDLAENKFMKSNTKIDGDICYLFPNLKTIRLRGTEASNIPDSITTIREKHVKPMWDNEEVGIEIIKIQNSLCSYSLTYNSEKRNYQIDDISYTYDQRTLERLYSIFSQIYEGCRSYSVIADEEILKIQNDPNTVKATVTLSDGKEYKIYIIITPDYEDNYFPGDVLYESDNRRYDFDLACGLLLKDKTEFKAN